MPAQRPARPAGEPSRRRGTGRGDTSQPDRRAPSGSGPVRPDGPPIQADITGRELDRAVERQLRALPEKLALRVARHLVAAGRVIDTDPELAYQHTLAARSRAARLAIVREACGEAAYAAGRYAEALTEFRAVRRMAGSPDFLPVIADCERALGRPRNALAIAAEPAVRQLDAAGRAEMLIVGAGARLDLGQPEAAVLALEPAVTGTPGRTPAAARLRYAYAEALLASDRLREALEWFHRAAADDAENSTDAAQRAAALEGLEILDLETNADAGAEPNGDG
jgi:tetratricopeptide (TPR) repeat protein